MKKANLLSKGILLSILIITQGILGGCSNSLMDKEKQPEQVQIEKVKFLSRNQISVEYKPTVNPNLYNAIINWPAFDGVVKIKNQENLYIDDDNQNLENEG